MNTIDPYLSGATALAPRDPVRDPGLSNQTDGELVRTYKRHIPELDGLRAVAVALVIFNHILKDFQDLHLAGLAGRVFAIWLRVTKAGWLGVDVFFVLSGFLITGVLLDALGTPHFYKNFYTRRVLRIFPLYYLILLIMTFWYAFPWKFLGLSAVFLANMAPYLGVRMVLRPLWSLSVEEHFYLLWPWLIRFLRPRWLVAVCLGVIAGEPLLRLVCFPPGGLQEYASWFRFDGMALGALLAILLRSRHAPAIGRLGVSLVVLSPLAFVLLLPFGGNTRTSVVGSTVIYTLASTLTTGVMALILARPDAAWSAPLRWRAVRFIGDISFCLYLVHWLVLDVWSRVVPAVSSGTAEAAAATHPISTYLAKSLFVWSLSAFIGWISLVYFEGPIRRRRAHFEARPARW